MSWSWLFSWFGNPDLLPVYYVGIALGVIGIIVCHIRMNKIINEMLEGNTHEERSNR